MSLRDRAKKPQESKTMPRNRLRSVLADAGFLGDFDPEKSSRERRKLSRKLSSVQLNPNKNTLYDERGRLRDGLIDVCDCLDVECVGCFMPCPICSSTKCGPVCRVNRKFAFDSIRFDGKDDEIKNKYAKN